MGLQLSFISAGLSQPSLLTIQKNFPGTTFTICDSFEEVLALADTGPATHAFLCGPELKGVGTDELLQTARMIYATTPLYYVSDQTQVFDRPLLLKNGAQEAYLLPMDASVLLKALAEINLGAEHKVYTAVSLVDIEPDTRLNFELTLFLPSNNKYITYAGAGDVLNGDRLARLKKHKVNSVYVPAHQIGEFYSYSANRLKELSSPGGTMSETERKAKLQSSVRDLVGGLLSESFSKNFGSGKKVVSHAKEIVSKFITDRNPGDWYHQLTSQVGGKGDSYSHVSNVSSFAALFSIALGVGNPEELAVAGLFHDIGIAELPIEIQKKNPKQMTPEEFEIYKTHPTLSANIMKARKLIVPDALIQAVLQHHERWTGKGYPEGIAERRFKKESQILALADQFDYLTSSQENLAPLSPDQVIRQLEREVILDPTFLRELKGMWPPAA